MNARGSPQLGTARASKLQLQHRNQKSNKKMSACTHLVDVVVGVHHALVAQLAAQQLDGAAGRRDTLGTMGRRGRQDGAAGQRFLKGWACVVVLLCTLCTCCPHATCGSCHAAAATHSEAAAAALHVSIQATTGIFLSTPSVPPSPPTGWR